MFSVAHLEILCYTVLNYGLFLCLFQPAVSQLRREQRGKFLTNGRHEMVPTESPFPATSTPFVSFIQTSPNVSSYISFEVGTACILLSECTVLTILTVNAHVMLLLKSNIK